MGRLPKRYIFADYESLRKVKFSKLQKVCNKVFILVDSTEETIPFYIVMQAQKLGKRVKWISVDNESDDFKLHLSFLIGALHEKANINIEFAILSDDEDYDGLVNFINDAGRNCIRIKTKKKKKKDSEDILPEEILKDEYFNEPENDDLSEAIGNLKTET